MKKVIKSLLLCVCLLTTMSHAEGEEQAASALTRFISSFVQGSSQFTVNSASFLYQVAINNPQATASFVTLAGFGWYGFCKIYKSEMMKKFREVMAELGLLKQQLADAKQDFLGRMNQLETNIDGVVKDQCGDVKKEIKESLKKECANVRSVITENAQEQKKHNEVTSDLLYRITGENQDLEKKVQRNKKILEGLVKGQKGLADQSTGIGKKIDQVVGDVSKVNDQQKKDSELLEKDSELLAALHKKFDELSDKMQEIWSATVENKQPELPEVMKDNLQERWNGLQSASDSRQKKVPVAEISVEQLMPRIQQMVVAQVSQMQQGVDSIGQGRTSSTLSGSQFTKIDLLDIVRQALAEQQDERSLNILLSSVDQIPDMMKGMLHLYKKADLLKKQIHLLQQLNCSMFHDLCSVVSDQNKQLVSKYNSPLQKNSPVGSIARGLHTPREKHQYVNLPGSESTNWQIVQIGEQPMISDQKRQANDTDRNEIKEFFAQIVAAKDDEIKRTQDVANKTKQELEQYKVFVKLIEIGANQTMEAKGKNNGCVYIDSNKRSAEQSFGQRNILSLPVGIARNRNVNMTLQSLSCSGK